MARIDNLENFLTDVAVAIREKRHMEQDDPLYKLKAENFDEEILQIEGTSDTSDATATVNDVISPKTFYANNRKLVGAIEATYKEVSSGVNNNIISGLNDICDYREDIGYYLRINSSSNTVEIYRIATDELVYTLNSDGAMAKAGGYTLVLKNAIFSREPVDGNIYNIYINGYQQAGGDTLYVGLIAVRFDVNRLLDEGLEYFKRYDTNGTRLGGRNYVTSIALTESNNYVFSGIQAESSYYEASPGYTTLYYVDNANRSITKKANVRIATGQYGCVAKCTDDMRFITLTNSSFNTIISVAENHSSMSVISNYTTSASNHRCILVPNGVIYNKQLRTTEGIVHTYEDYPFEYNDIVLSLGKYLFKFRNNEYIEVYVYNEITFEITFLKTINIKGTVRTDYYGNSSIFTLPAFPIFQYHNIVYLTSTGTKYLFAPTNDGTVLDKLIVKGNTMVNVSDIHTSPDKVLEGNIVVNSNGSSAGTMPNNGELNYAPSTEAQNIPLGYTSGGTIEPVTADIDSNIIPDNIKQGIEILGITGTYEPTGGDATSDANIQAKYLLEGYRAVSDGKWIEGEMINYGTVTMERTSEIQEIPSGYYDSLTVPIAQAYNLDGYNECLDALIYITHGAPVSYTELNYIQSTGTQYIDTGITMNKTDNVIIEQKCAISNDRYAGCNGYTQWTGDITNNVDSVVKVVYTSTNNTETIYVDGVQKTSNLWDNYNGSNVKIGIFKLGKEGNTWHESSAQVGILYYCKIYKNNTLVRDFVPAQRDEDSAVGLYDKVSKMFFVNNGTGNLISGGVNV